VYIYIYIYIYMYIRSLIKRVHKLHSSTLAPLGSPLPRASPQLKRFTATRARERREITLDEACFYQPRHPLSINDLCPTHFD